MTCIACRALCFFVGLWSLVKFWLLPFLDFHRRRGTFFPSPDQWPVLRFSYPSRALLMLVPMMTSSTPDDFAPDQTKVALRNAPVHSPNPFSLTQIRWSFTVLRSLSLLSFRTMHRAPIVARSNSGSWQAYLALVHVAALFGAFLAISNPSHHIGSVREPASAANS